MRRLKIGLDIDGVLADFAGPAMATARSIFPDADVHNRIWNLGLTDAQAAAVMEHYKHTVDAYANLDPLPGSEVLAELQGRHNFYFVTARNPTAGYPIEVQSHMWLVNYLDIDFPCVIVVDSGKYKVDIYNALRLDAFVDDRVDTVNHMRSHQQNCYVFDQPWNKACEAPRVYSVKEYIETVEKQFGI